MFKNTSHPAGIYLFKVNNGNSRTKQVICSKLKIKTEATVTPFWCFNFSVSIFDLEQVRVCRLGKITDHLKEFLETYFQNVFGLEIALLPTNTHLLTLNNHFSSLYTIFPIFLFRATFSEKLK